MLDVRRRREQPAVNRVKVADLHLGDEIEHNGTWHRVVRIFAPIPTAKGPARRGLRLRAVDDNHDMYDVGLPVDDWVDVR